MVLPCVVSYLVRLSDVIVINYLSKSVFSLISSGWAKGSEIMVPEISASEANRVTSESGERNWFYTLSWSWFPAKKKSPFNQASIKVLCKLLLTSVGPKLWSLE